MKDTFVSTALAKGVTIRWLEQQTGENYATLKKHYSKWMPLEVPSELARFTDVEPSRGKIVPSWAQSVGTISVSARNRGGKKMVPTGFEPVLPT